MFDPDEIKKAVKLLEEQELEREQRRQQKREADSFDWYSESLEEEIEKYKELLKEVVTEYQNLLYDSEEVKECPSCGVTFGNHTKSCIVSRIEEVL